MAKNKHLTQDERLQIEQWLLERKPIKQIAGKLDKHPGTISREIRARSIPSDKGAPYRITNRCIKRKDCKILHLCVDNRADKAYCNRKCSSCNLCNELCSDFVEQICYKLYEPPYVCNGCIDEWAC